MWGSALTDSNHRKVTQAYAEQRNRKVTDWTDRVVEGRQPDMPVPASRIRIEGSHGDRAYVDFDETGHVCGVAIPPSSGPESKPEPRSWVNRLLRWRRKHQ